MPTKRSKSKKGAKEMKGVLTKEEVAKRGTGTAIRTPLEEFEQNPRDETRAFMSCVMFLTRLPCPGWCDHHPGHLLRGMAYFPILGALIGIWQAIIYDAAASVFGSLVGAGLSFGGTLWLDILPRIYKHPDNGCGAPEEAQDGQEAPKEPSDGAD